MVGCVFVDTVFCFVLLKNIVLSCVVLCCNVFRCVVLCCVVLKLIMSDCIILSSSMSQLSESMMKLESAHAERLLMQKSANGDLTKEIQRLDMR